MGWPVVPDGLREVLVQQHERYGDALPPVMVTENGVAFPDVARRRRRAPGRRPATRGSTCASTSPRWVVRSTRASTSAATSCGRSSTTSSGPRATGRGSALVYTDYATQRRIPKTSFAWYRAFLGGASMSVGGQGPVGSRRADRRGRHAATCCRSSWRTWASCWRSTRRSRTCCRGWPSRCAGTDKEAALGVDHRRRGVRVDHRQPRRGRAVGPHDSRASGAVAAVGAVGCAARRARALRARLPVDGHRARRRLGRVPGDDQRVVRRRHRDHPGPGAGEPAGSRVRAGSGSRRPWASCSASRSCPSSSSASTPGST